MSAPLFSLEELRAAAARIYQEMPLTPQYAWPLLAQRFGAEVWVKHENHTPTGAFKIRGGIIFIDWLMRETPGVTGIITATRGNHGQSQARAAKKTGLEVVIVVPRGNSVEKNEAMRGFGAELIEFGDDFDAARDEAHRLAGKRNMTFVSAFHTELVRGVASYGLELFDAAGALDAVYVPIGSGTGICGTIAARDALGLKTKVIGVVSSQAPAAKNAFESGELTPSESAKTFADGVAVRVPNETAYGIYANGADHIVAVDDDLIAEAMRIYWKDTHNLAEGAGAVALAGLMAEQEQMLGKRVGVILTGGNIDQGQVATVMAGQTPLS